MSTPDSTTGAGQQQASLHAFNPIVHRNRVTVVGDAGPAAVFIHGFGCGQTAWHQLAPRFAESHRVVTYDLTGCGKSDPSAYDYLRYSSLDAHASDLLEILRCLDISDAILVGHSVGAMIAVRAIPQHPSICSRLVMIGASPCYIDTDDYRGGFSRADIDEMLEVLTNDFAAWSRNMAPVLMRNADRPMLSNDLADSFIRADPNIAKHFAKVTFLSDHRHLVGGLAVPALILQCENDAIAPVFVGEWLSRHIRQSTLSRLRASGHYSHISAPAETCHAIHAFLRA